MTIFKVGGMAKKKGFAGPAIGVKVADQNKRNFSDEKLREGQGIIGLQVNLCVCRHYLLLTMFSPIRDNFHLNYSKV